MHKKLKQQILFCLEEYRETRDNDTLLTVMVWKEFHKKSLFIKNGIYCVKLSTILKLPSQDNVKRIRARIQNTEKMYLPSDPEVREKRRIAEKEWLAWARKNK